MLSARANAVLALAPSCCARKIQASIIGKSGTRGAVSMPRLRTRSLRRFGQTNKVRPREHACSGFAQRFVIASNFAPAN